MSTYIALSPIFMGYHDINILHLLYSTLGYEFADSRIYFFLSH